MRFGRGGTRLRALADHPGGLGTVPAGLAVELGHADGVETPDVVVESERRGPWAREYPTRTDEYLYTWGPPGVPERAFLDLLTSPLGQTGLVRPRRDVVTLDAPDTDTDAGS